MDESAILIVLVVLGWLIAAPIVALVKAGHARREAKGAHSELERLLVRLKSLEREVLDLKRSAVPPSIEEPSILTPIPPPIPQRAKVNIPEIIPPPNGIAWLEKREAEDTRPSPLPLPERRKLVNHGDSKKPEMPTQVAMESKEPFSLERFMGVKLFAWLGGVAMFFGVIFFVKYAFENNLIPPAVRIALGFITGTGLLIGGLWAHRLERYRVLAQAFLATGVLILYGVSFAAHAIYHFAAFGTLVTFGLMALITFAAFIIAVRLNALVVAVLGMLGGFLTPLLLSTGQDAVFGLFGYIALLDIGLLAVSRHGRWWFLTIASALGTALMQMGWYLKFFAVGHYDQDSRTLIPMAILLFFIFLFLAGGWLGRRRPGRLTAGVVLGLAAVAMWFAALMLGFEQVPGRYGLLYGFLLLVNLTVIVLVTFRPQYGLAQLVAAGLTFLHLAAWTHGYLTETNLPGALGLYLLFGILHAVAPVFISRRMPKSAAIIPSKAGQWFAPLVLVMMVMPVMSLSPVPMLLWVGILIADLLVIALAASTGAVKPVLASLALTMVLAGLWLFQIPTQVNSLMPFLGVITGSCLIFSLAGLWLLRRTAAASARQISATALLPVASAALPFVLLVMALSRLPVSNPAPVFGVASLMTALLVGLAIFGKKGPLILVALGGSLAVEAVWHLHHFNVASPTTALGWYLLFYGLFFALPFIFHRTLASESSPWIASALSGVGHFLLVHDLMKRAFPNSMMGLVPLAFAIPALLGLSRIFRKFPEMDEKQRSRLAWFGGVALFFITLIFPIQFSQQWVTVSWAIEGALLLWLFRRVPHPGLQLTGLALLAVAFIRLMLNPATFSGDSHSSNTILNWHLYTYGLVAMAQFAGGNWFTDPVGRWKMIHPQGVLYTLGGVLLFLLLNIEIAEYFTPPGDRCIAFKFGGNFARDMTCSIAWGLFSLSLLGVGFWKASQYARYAAVLLLVFTLLKVFLHDLAAVQNIFRIGALMGVAITAFIASFLYQRFFDRSKLS
jgi:Predicted membrane protein (DUF2339)